MKRYNHLFEKIVSMDNLILAEQKARKHKSHRKDVQLFLQNKDELLEKLQELLISGKYHTSQYDTFTIYEPKERLIYKLPYYPDRIVHHAIMNILEKIWVNQFIPNVYNCIKKRGIHKAAKDIRKALRKDPNNTKYCLKLDIRHFYPTIDHDILKQIIRRKIKDIKLLQLLDEIIDSTDGVPIGNYLSQFFANLYLCYLDRDIITKYSVYYFRYADDIAILSGNKEYLQNVFYFLKNEISKLELTIKSNYQIFPVDIRGIDMVGYRFYSTHTLLRKTIKKNICKCVFALNKTNIKYEDYKQSICSYLGWMKYCNAYTLGNKIFKYKALLYYLR